MADEPETPSQPEAAPSSPAPEPDPPPPAPEPLTDPNQSLSTIRRMEQKVSAQLKSLKESVVLAFTGGFSFKHGDDEPKVIGRRSPTGALEQRGSSFGCVLVGVLVIAVVGGVLGWLVHQERSQQPADGPLIFQGPK